MFYRYAAIHPISRVSWLRYQSPFSGDLKVMAMVMMGVQQHSGGAIFLIEMGC
jgi:hypothetical protein